MQPDGPGVEVEVVEVQADEEPTKLVDLMAALQASVNAATKERDDKRVKPVSVAEAKEAKEKRAKAAGGSKGKSASRASKSDAEEERPARRRKTA